MISPQVLGGSWDLVGKVTSAFIGVISTVASFITLVKTRSRDPLNNPLNLHGILIDRSLNGSLEGTLGHSYVTPERPCVCR